MKRFIKYLFLFLAIVGINISAWAGDVNIINNLTGCAAAAGQQTTITSSQQSSNVELQYTINAGKTGEDATVSVALQYPGPGESTALGSFAYRWDRVSGKTYRLRIFASSINGGTYGGYKDRNVVITINCPNGNPVYTLTYDANGGETTCLSGEDHEVGDNFNLCDVVPTRAGFTFGGWRYNSTDYAAGASFTMPDADATLVAQWSGNQYAITLNGNAAGVASGSANVRMGATAITDFARVYNPGATILGYYTADRGGRRVLDENGNLSANVPGYTSGGQWIKAENTTLYAQYKYANYQTYCPRTLTFDRNGQSTATPWPSDQTGKSGFTPVRPGTDPVVAGQTFGGWYTTQACTGAEFNFASVTEDMTLYAKWTLNGTDITLHGNNAHDAVPEETSACRVLIGASDNICWTPTAPTGYTFAGFYTGQAAGSQLYNNEGVMQLNKTVSSTVYTDATGWACTTKQTLDLYAHWTASEYTITLDKNGGAADKTVTATYLSAALKPASFAHVTRSNYTLLGYTTERDGSIIVIDAEKHLMADIAGYTDAEGKWIKTENTTLYAKWAANNYSVTLYANYTDGADGSATFTFGTRTRTAYTGVARAGYTLDGYYTTDGGGTKVLDAEGNLVDAQVTYWLDAEHNWIKGNNDGVLYAHWTPINYTLTYVNTKDAANSNPTTYTVESNITFTALSSVTGYTFAGWSPATITAGTTGNQTVTASWTVNQHTLTWDFDGGATTSDSYTAGGSVEYGALITAPEDNTMSKTGYTFAGWSGYSASMPNADLTITAQWTPANYTIICKKNVNGDESTCVDDLEAPYLSSPEVTYTCAVPEGFHLASWSISPEIAKTDDVANKKVTITSMPAEMVTVTANFLPNLTVTGGDIKVTSANGMTVQSVMTVSATGAFKSGTLTVANVTGTQGGTFAAVITNAASDGTNLNATIAIKYTPVAANVTETATMHAVIGDQDVTFTVTGRSLPEKFVIATKVDGAWYALTNLNPSNTYTTRALIPIKVDNATAPTAATVYSSTENAMAWTLEHIMVSKRADYGTGAHFTRVIDTKALAGNASGLEFGAAVPAGTADDYLNHIWVANSADLTNYTMDNVGATGYSISASAAGFSMSNESAATLRFLAYTKEAPKTVTWYNAMLGSEFAHNAAENGMITIPAGTPTACDAAAGAGYTFYGWRAGEIGTYETKAQTLIVDGQTALSDVTYYAVFKSTDATPKYRTACPSVNSITFKANGGTGADYKVYTELTTYVAPYYDTEAGFTAPANHVFVGWLVDGDTDYSHIIKPNGTNKITGLSGDVIYNAIWVGELNVTANVNLTTGNGISVYTTPESGNLITLSSTDFAAVTSIKITYKDKSGTVVTPANSLFRICYAPEYVAAGKNAYEVADASNLPVSTSGAYEYKYAISYTPKAANQMDEGTILLEAYRNTTNLCSTEFKVYGRSLPERFVIAMKNPNNGYWYALKNVLGSTAVGATPAPEMITVDNNTNPTKATLAPASTFYQTAARFEPMKHRGGLRLQSVSENKFLTATKTDNTSFYMPAGNDDDQQFYLNSTDLSRYKVTLDPATGSTRYISMNGGTIGWYATEAKDVYFLPVENVQTPAEFQVVEWKTNSVVVMYTGVAVSATTQVGTNAASSAQTLTTVKKDQCVYELSTVDLTSEYGKVLTVQFVDGSSKMICVPLIVSGETTAASGTASNDVVILKGATFSAAATDYRYPNITVYGGGKLVVGTGKKLSFSNLYLRCGGVVDGNYDYVYPQVVLNGTINEGTTNTHMYIDYVTTKDQYYTFVTPFAISQSAIQYPQDIYGSNVTAANTGSFEFQYYDGSARAAGATGWVVQPEDQDIVPGQGYTFLGMPKKINGTRQKFGLHRMPMTEGTTDVMNHETTISYLISVAPHPSSKDNNAGWNLIGNPYMATVRNLENNSIHVGELVHTNNQDGSWTGGWHWDEESVTNEQRFLVIPSDDGQSYESVQANTAVLPAFKNFFVQIASGSLLSIPVDHRDGRSLAPGRRVEAEEKEIEIPLYMEAGEFRDALTYLIQSDYTEAFEFNADMYKMLNNKDTRVNLYGLMESTEMSFVAVNAETMNASVPVGFSVPAAGEFTIGLSNDQISGVQSVWLTDNEMNITWDLMSGDYEFNVGQKETNNTRFTLRIVMTPQTPTDIGGGGEPDRRDVRKVIFNDKLYIIVDGKVYDATGKTVK